MDINEVADELYGLEPADFVEIRTERVAEARSAGDRALAKDIARLRRPTTVAWMVNILAREHSGDVENLLELGEAMREAQRHLAGDDLRRLTTQRQQVVRALARAAGALAAEHGHRANETALREVGQSLHAALADPEIGELVRLGRLVTAVSYSGIGPAGLSLVGGRAREPKAPAAPPGEKDQTGEPDQTAIKEAIKTARAQLADAEAAEQDAQAAARSARSDAETAAATVAAASTRVDELRTQLAQAEQELQFAGRAEQAATDQAEAAERERADAAELVSRLRQELDSLT